MNNFFKKTFTKKTLSIIASIIIAGGLIFVSVIYIGQQKNEWSNEVEESIKRNVKQQAAVIESVDRDLSQQDQETGDFKTEIVELKEEIKELKNQKQTTDTTEGTGFGGESSKDPVYQDSILCNGIYWSPCSEGQTFHCPATGDAQCLYENTEPDPVAQDPLIKIEKCKIAAQTRIDNFLIAGKMAINEAFKECVQNQFDILQQELGGAPGTVGTIVDIARSACKNIVQEPLDKLDNKADEIYNRHYLECLDK